MTTNETSLWRKDVEVLYDEQVLRERIAELGAEITKDYVGKELCVVGILKGSFVFMSDLVRQIDVPLHTEFIGISSYGDDTQSSGVVQITADLTTPIEGKDVLIVEDIIDTGLTMSYLLSNFATRKPASIKVCTLLEKPERAEAKNPIHYVGFTIPNKFVIGYGLDFAGKYRNLPYIGVYNGPV